MKSRWIILLVLVAALAPSVRGDDRGPATVRDAMDEMKRIARLAGELKIEPPAPVDLPKPTTPKFNVRRDVIYVAGKPGDAERQAMDIYQPAGVKDAPVLLFVHGGAWRQGDRGKLYCREVCKAFAERGILTAAVGYRLSPAVKHPAHVQDVAAAVAWMHEHARDYGGRADRMFLSGHSAGGHLVALVMTDPKYLAAHKMTPDQIAGVFPLSGVYTLQIDLEAVPQFRWLAQIFGDKPADLADASPLAHVHKDELTKRLPPFRIVVGQDEPSVMRLQAAAFCVALHDAGVDARWMERPKVGHMSLIMAAGHDGDPTTLLMLDTIAKRTADLDAADRKRQEEEKRQAATSQPDQGD
ncbi:MAG: Acetyl esterase [Phycisphaerae bacterium]|nr:Acetyl esterase [Phycisphaerae bacterium]